MYDELIKRLREAAIKADSGNEISESLYRDILQAADAIEELSKPKWIPVTERLPEEAGFTLIFTANGNPGVCYFTNGWWGGYSKDHIAHWLPLPEPPKEE